MENDDMGINKYIKGTCMEMCPQAEIEMRQNEGLLHRLEMLSGTENSKRPKADPKRMVKTFSRSAAGREMPSEDSIRPADVLLETVNYLLHDVITVEYLPWNEVYDYISDRLRAVRQDIVIQNLPRAYTIALLQPIIRFYAYASYRLCEEHVHKFDPEINKKHLQECLKRLLVLYDDCDYWESKYSKIHNDKVNTADNFSSILGDVRPQFEALYVLFNLGNTDAIIRVLSLPVNLKTRLAKDALTISLCYLNGNWVRVCRMIKKLPPLLAAVAITHLPHLRRNALKIMSTSYSCKNLQFPALVLKDSLLYTKLSDLMEDCRYYNVTYNSDEHSIQFMKGSFDMRKSIIRPKHEAVIEEKLSQHSIPSLVLIGDF